MASAARVAEAAWDRLVELHAAEHGRRSDPNAVAAHSDGVLERWHASSKRQFLSAWRHVASMASPDAVRNDYASYLTQPSRGVVLKAVEALAVDVAGLLTVQRSDDGTRTFHDALSAIEGVLVACLGHYSSRPRALSVRLLNALYDGVDWQLAEAHRPVVAFTGDPFIVDVYTPYVLGSGSAQNGPGNPNSPPTSSDSDPSDTNANASANALAVRGAGADEVFRVLVCAPSYDRVVGASVDHVLTMHAPAHVTREEVWLPAPRPGAGAGGGDGTGKEVALVTPSGDGKVMEPYVRTTVTRIRLNLAPFPRCGFFDWRVVVVTADGTCRPVTAVTPLSVSSSQAEDATPAAPATPANSAPISPTISNTGTIAQGRFIVHRAGLKDEHVHEMIVDLEGMKFSEAGDIVKHGTFADVSAALRNLKGNGVTSLYVLGAIERDNGWGEGEVEEGSAAAAAGASVADSGPDHQPSPDAMRLGHHIKDGMSVDSQGGDSESFGFYALDGSNPHESTSLVSMGIGGHGHSSSYPGAAPGGGIPGAGLTMGHGAFALMTPFGAGPGFGAHHGPGAPGAGHALIAGGTPAAAAPGIGSAADPQQHLPPGMRAYAARPDANPHAVVDRHTPNRMLGGAMGFFRLVQEARTLGIRVMVQCDAAVSSSRPHRKYRSLYAHTLDTKGQAVVHAGTDALENQWEDQQLLNYRKVETWDLLISEAKTLVQNFGVGGLYLTDAQSYPFIMEVDEGELFRRDVDGEGHYSPREILEGEVVVANAETGYWSSRAARVYPNPLLVKLSRALWAIAPDFTITGESHWGRASALLRSGIVPHALDIVSAMASTLGRYCDKNGHIESVALPREVPAVAFLRALVGGEGEGVVPAQAAPQFVQQYLHAGRGFPNPLTSLLVGPGGRMPKGGAQIQLRSLTSSRLPYPALLLGRSAWTGVDLMYSLPGVPMTFQDEKAGRAYRVDVTGTYQYNERYLEEERKKREKRLVAEKHAAKYRAAAASAAASGPAGARNVSRGHTADPNAPNAQSGDTSSQYTSSSTPVPGSLPSQVANVMREFSGGQQPISVAARAIANASGASGGGIGSPHSQSVTSMAEWYEGDVGVGGVVPAVPVRGAPAFKLSRTGFSHIDLAGMDKPGGAGGTTSPAASSPLAASGRPPLASSANAAVPQPSAMAPPPAISRPSTAPGRGMTGSSSSPALQNLLLTSPDDDSASDSYGGGGGRPTAADSAASSAAPRPTNIEEDDDEDDDDIEETIAGKASPTAGTANAFGFRVPIIGGRKEKRGASKLRESWGPDASGSKDGSTVTAQAASSVGMGGTTASTSSMMETGRVQSWAVLESMTFKGDQDQQLRDSVKGMASSEARLRQEVGPQFGFDLAQIGGHYEHRRQLRNRYAVLRNGELTVLTARHRFGEHGHVFAFARHIQGQVAVIAANFNGHPSTFAVDCSPLTGPFGSSTTADASASVSQLMSASIGWNEAIRKVLDGGMVNGNPNALPAPAPASSSAAGAKPNANLSIGSTSALPSLNLRGGVWEVRNVFASDAKWGTLARFDGHSFTEADGPLVGIVTSEEAAYAPMLATLEPHRSYCWLYCQAQGSAAGGATGMRSPLAMAMTLNKRGSMHSMEAETDPAAMKWLFASSLLRLQSVIRLKECGLATAVIHKSEVNAAGSYEALMRSRHIGSNEPWISPGEALKDEEIQSAARHNLVYSLLRHVVKRAYRAILAARTAARNSGSDSDAASWKAVAAGTAGDDASKATLRQIINETATLIEAALRVLVTHWQLREGPPIPGSQEPAHLTALPLPSLHGAMNRGTTGSVSPSSAGDPAWYCIDGDAAVTVSRCALFLAVKDVVAQAAASGKSAAPATAPSSSAPTSTDVSDEDATLSAVIFKAITRVAKGQTAAGEAVARAKSDASGASAAFAQVLAVEAGVVAAARRLAWTNSVSPIVFVTPELGKWSTVGGLGVMVDELSVGLAELGSDVICISPYYNVNRKGVGDYLRHDNITYTGRNVAVWVGSERIEMGIHEGRVHNVRLFFLHHAEVFPRPYPSMDAYGQIRVLSAFAKATLELLCQWQLIPSLIVTNDWFTGLVPAYARMGQFGDAFKRTDFMHIAHNLDPDYEGRLWPNPGQGALNHVHGLPSHLLVDPHWADTVINPTRAALMCSDTWATVSRSYRQDLLNSSPLRGLLRLTPHPFAHPNGIPVKQRLQRLSQLPFPTHEEAKTALQRKYFGFENGDPSLPLFAFVGRITLQKGVHLILQCVDELLSNYNGRCMFLVGGMASQSDTYGIGCSHKMRDLAFRHRGRFWANPDLFFTDGDLVNLGADFCLMPSMFEPGGIVQQEFFVAGTPVIAFKTGGLKDTVFEYDPATGTGNGFTFEAHAVHDFQMAIHRAIAVYHSPGYAQIRANARASVMDLAVVSLAWFREFHRLRRALPPAPQKPQAMGIAKFALQLGEIPALTADSVVEVTGSFGGWQRKTKLNFVAPNRFEAELSLPPGTFQYKFVVDGKWSASPSYPTVDDGTGNVNNVITVASTTQGDDEL